MPSLAIYRFELLGDDRPLDGNFVVAWKRPYLYKYLPRLSRRMQTILWGSVYPDAYTMI